MTAVGTSGSVFIWYWLDVWIIRLVRDWSFSKKKIKNILHQLKVQEFPKRKEKIVMS